MLLHCGPVRGCFLDDNYVAAHRTRNLLHELSLNLGDGRGQAAAA